VKKQALEGKRVNAFLMDPRELTIVGIDTKHTKREEHPLYDPRIERPISDAWALNILLFGVQQPVIVRKNGPLSEIVMGRRRVRGARIANDPAWRKRMEVERGVAAGTYTALPPVLVPVMAPIKVDDFGALARRILENEDRQDDGPIAKAKNAAQLRAMGASDDMIAAIFRVSVKQVQKLLAVLDLDAKVQTAIERNEVTFSAAVQLTDLTREEQVAKLEEWKTVGAPVSVTEAKRQRRERAKAPEAATDDTRGAKLPVSALRKIAEHDDFKELPAEARHMLAVVLGETGKARQVKGLTKILSEIGVAS
jgi:ParB-like chromosome segregation protein Spo0J